MSRAAGFHVRLALAGTLIALAATAPAAGGARGKPFIVGLTQPVLQNNAIVAIRLHCPRTQHGCYGAVAFALAGDPAATNPVLRRYHPLAVTAPFVLGAGRTVTYRLPVPLSLLPALRQATRMGIGAFALAGDVRTRRIGIGESTAIIPLATPDPRLLNTKRLTLRLTRGRIVAGPALALNIHCSKVDRVCKGILGISALPPRGSSRPQVPIGIGLFSVRGGATARLTFPLDRARLARVRGSHRRLLLYAIANDPIRHHVGSAVVTLRT